MDRSGPGGPRGPQPPLVDQECSGPPWTTLRHFPDACFMIEFDTHDVLFLVSEYRLILSMFYVLCQDIV